jgi:hypothetical protein
VKVHQKTPEQLPVGIAKKSNRKNGDSKDHAASKKKGLTLTKQSTKQAYKKPKLKPVPAAAPKHRRLFKFMNKLLYNTWDRPISVDDEAGVEEAISLIFTPLVGPDDALVGPDDARLDTQDVKTVLSHVCDCQALLDRLHIPGDMMAFVREAAFKEQDNPNSLELEEHFKAKIRTAARRVVTCINAAKKHLERLKQAYTTVAETSRRAKPLYFVAQPISDFTSDTLFVKALNETDTDFGIPGHYAFQTMVGDGILFLCHQAITKRPGYLGVDFWLHY